MRLVRNAKTSESCSWCPQEDPQWTLEKEMAKRRGVPYPAAEPRQKVDDPEFQAEEAADISVGDRCEVQPGAKRGTVR